MEVKEKSSKEDIPEHNSNTGSERSQNAEVETASLAEAENKQIADVKESEISEVEQHQVAAVKESEISEVEQHQVVEAKESSESSEVEQRQIAKAKESKMSRGEDVSFTEIEVVKSNSNNDLDDLPKNSRFANVKIERRSSQTIRALEAMEAGPEFDEAPKEIASVMDSIGPINKILKSDEINPLIRVLKANPMYPMETRATELAEILTDDDDYEFDQVLRATHDDAHACGQPPLTFLRKLLAVVCYPRLLADASFPEDVKERARTILRECRGHSIGSLTDPAGIEGVRKHVAIFIENRDNVRSKWQDIFLTAGSSEAIKNILKLLACNINGKKAGVMIPIPTKIIYQLLVKKNDMEQIGYYLNEENNWSIDIDELNRAYNEAVKSCNPRAIIVINPGQPTGNVLTQENIEEIIKFAYEKQLLICANEVNQFDIYSKDVEFVSFKKVLKELGHPYSKMELASAMSVSGGFLGEGGLRGGCVEFINVDPDVKHLYFKYLETKKCPPVMGQVAVEVLVNPPEPDEPSYNEYINEKENIMDLHRIQAGMVTVAFNNFTNFSCTPILAGRHAFPRVNFPELALKAAEEANQSPDLYFALQLLEQKGICVSPGCQFGQKKNTYHFCIAHVLPPDDLNLMLGRFKQFNSRFNEAFLCKCKKRKAGHKK